MLRTFSKAYGLAGLRVGFAIAHEPVAAALRKTAVPFGVSQLAQDAAVASLRAEDELLGRVGTLVCERNRVVEALRGQGWTVPETQANFVWLRLGERTLEFAAHCEQAGVVVRPFAGEGVRVTIGETEANDTAPQGDRGVPQGALTSHPLRCRSPQPRCFRASRRRSSGVVVVGPAGHLVVWSGGHLGVFETFRGVDARGDPPSRVESRCVIIVVKCERVHKRVPVVP